jgi:hypothetical protein
MGINTSIDASTIRPAKIGLGLGPSTSVDEGLVITLGFAPTSGTATKEG